ncbi:unnamed protein product, partial [Linum tenue]
SLARSLARVSRRSDSEVCNPLQSAPSATVLSLPLEVAVRESVGAGVLDSAGNPCASDEMGQIQYSEKYFDDTYEYRHVVLPPEVAKLLPKNRLLSEVIEELGFPIACLF